MPSSINKHHVKRDKGFHYLRAKGGLLNHVPQPAGTEHVEDRAGDECDEAVFMKICNRKENLIIP